MLEARGPRRSARVTVEEVALTCNHDPGAHRVHRFPAQPAAPAGPHGPDRPRGSRPRRSRGSRHDTAELRRALDGGELRVFYQPVVDLCLGRVTSLEALVRWQHPGRGLVGPDEFISLAERHGLISQLTRFVVESVTGQLHAWRAAGWPALTCSVNLSVGNLTDGETFEELVGHLSVMKGLVTVEVTESGMAGADAVAALVRLARRGVPCAIDDFGTGYSSLAALKQLPAQALKIDRGFLRGIDDDKRDQAVVRAIVTMAEAFDLGVVAEGIETEGAARLARDAGVTHGQGYWFARPMPPDALEEWMATSPYGHGATRD